jgi:transposase-like protein
VLNRAEEDAVMLVELSMVEQRYHAVREVLDGATVTDTATRYGVDRRNLHRWLIRYANDGLAALSDKSSRPDRCPHQMAPEIEARIVELRRSHSGWGPRTLLNKLRQELEHPPSRAASYRCLVRHRLIQPKPRRRRREDYKRWERSRAMELWHPVPFTFTRSRRRHHRRRNREDPFPPNEIRCRNLREGPRRK